MKCLNLGADDILMKPFSLGELAARCRALGRRRERFADPLRCGAGDVELNRMERKVTRAGILIELTVKEFSLLEYLLQARGRCCSRSELLSEVWQMSPDAGTNVVDVYVNYLRKKLAVGLVDGAVSDVIETVRGQGYQIGRASGLGVARKGVQAVGISEENLPAGMTRTGLGPREVRGGSVACVVKGRGMRRWWR